MFSKTVLLFWTESYRLLVIWDTLSKSRRQTTQSQACMTFTSLTGWGGRDRAEMELLRLLYLSIAVLISTHN